jgi:acyl dehydratase
MAGRFLEDFAVGELIESGEEYEITPERLAAYAAEYDPQLIHLDAPAAEREMFGGIVASGWHSLSVTMRLMVRSRLLAGGPIVGIGIDGLRFLQPVRPGDRLRARAEVLEIRPSRSHPDRGYLVLRITTLRHDGVPVLTQDWTLLVPRRASSPP